MAETETVVLTNMCMIHDGMGNVLVEDRSDPGWPGYVFPGGHVEVGEAFVDSVIREVREETGLTIRNPKLCGLKQFFREDGTRYIVFLYRADEFEGELISSEEGRVFWVRRSELREKDMARSFPDMLKIFDSPAPAELFYPKDGGQNGVARYEIR